MKKATATHIFISEYYGNTENLRLALNRDWLAVQYNWSCFTDALCKNGDITMQQYESWLFPWPRH